MNVNSINTPEGKLKILTKRAGNNPTITNLFKTDSD